MSGSAYSGAAAEDRWFESSPRYPFKADLLIGFFMSEENGTTCRAQLIPAQPQKGSIESARASRLTCATVQRKQGKRMSYV